MTLRVGIAGLGTVGSGVLRLLRDNAELVAARAGRPVVVTAVSARERGRDRGVPLDGVRWHEDARALAEDPGVDVVVELIGGSEGAGRALVEASLRAGRPVVTANKALLAVHGAALAELAERAGVMLGFEAAVAGGIPVIKALREGLAGNRIERVAGILNGTCNYILTTMRESGRDFAAVLGEAQALGYAEADPSFDVDGVDAAHKLAILAALAFGRPVAFDELHVEGIRAVSALDIAFAEELGFRIKLLGIAQRGEAGVLARVHPCMVARDASLARVEGVFNAVVAEGDFVGRLMLEGRGAGAGPTASAVVADLVDLARGRVVPVWGVASAALSHSPAGSMADRVGAFYLRLMVRDRPGVIADVAAALRDHDVSVASMLQHGRGSVEQGRGAMEHGRGPAEHGGAPGESVAMVLVTHETRERDMAAALGDVAGLDAVLEPPVLIRIEAG